LSFAPWELEQVAPLEAPILDKVFAPFDPVKGGPLEVPSLELTDAPSLELSEAPFEIELCAPFETATLEPLFLFLELEQGAHLETHLEAPSSELTEVSSLEMSEAPLEMELFAPAETPTLEPLSACSPGAGSGCSQLEPEQGAPLEAPLEVPALELT
jgi:hypothetical protein